jgi:hypothetical protein
VSFAANGFFSPQFASACRAEASAKADLSRHSFSGGGSASEVELSETILEINDLRWLPRKRAKGA